MRRQPESSQERADYGPVVVRVGSSSHDAVARASGTRPTIDSEPRYVRITYMYYNRSRVPGSFSPEVTMARNGVVDPLAPHCYFSNPSQ